MCGFSQSQKGFQKCKCKWTEMLCTAIASVIYSCSWSINLCLQNVVHDKYATKKINKSPALSVLPKTLYFFI